MNNYSYDEETAYNEKKESLASTVASKVGSLFVGEAEASPIFKPILNVAGKQISKIASSTAKKLIGKEFRGQIIKDVTKGVGDKRFILLDNDTVYPVTKDVVHDLARKYGTVTKEVEFAGKGYEGKLDQALDSLKRHEAQAIPGSNPMMIKTYHKYYQEDLDDSVVERANSCLVKRNKLTFTMPTVYADLLEKEGYLKILKRLK